MSEQQSSKKGRPANPTLIEVTARQLAFKNNVRFAHLWNSPDYSPTDISLYGDAIERMWESIKDEVEASTVFRFKQTPVAVEVNGMYVPQDGNTRTLTMLTHAPDKKFVIELRSKEFTDAESMEANTIRTDMSDLAIAYTIHRLKGAERKAAIRKSGWTDKLASQWLYIIDKLDPAFFIMLERGTMSIETALDLASQSAKLQAFLAEYKQELEEEQSVRRALQEVCGWRSYVSMDDYRSTVMPAADWNVAYTDGMNTIVFITDRAGYDAWYASHKKACCEEWDLDPATIEEHSGYKGSECTSENKVDMLPYDGKGKAYWYNHQVCYVQQDKARDTAVKVRKLEHRVNNTDARNYAIKHVMENAKMHLGTLNKHELAAIMWIQLTNRPDEYVDAETTMRKYLEYSSLREATMRSIVGDEAYDKSMKSYEQSYINKQQSALNEVVDKATASFNAAIAIFMPSFVPEKGTEEQAIYAWIEWLSDDALAQVKALDKRFYPFIKAQCKAMGVSASMGKTIDADVNRIIYAIKAQLKLKGDEFNRDLLAVKAEYQQWYKRVEDMAIAINDLAFPKLDTAIVIEWSWVNRMAAQWKSYLKDYYPKAVHLAWEGKHVLNAIKAAPKEQLSVMDTMHLLAEWLIMQGQTVASERIVPNPMPERKMETVSDSEGAHEVELEDDEDGWDDEKEAEYSDEVVQSFNGEYFVDDEDENNVRAIMNEAGDVIYEGESVGLQGHDEDVTGDLYWNDTQWLIGSWPVNTIHQMAAIYKAE